MADLKTLPISFLLFSIVFFVILIKAKVKHYYPQRYLITGKDSELSEEKCWGGSQRALYTAVVENLWVHIVWWLNQIFTNS